MNHRTWACLGLLFVVFAAPGCRRSVLNQEEDLKVANGEDKPYVIEAIRKEQTIKVEFKSDGVPVSVYVYLEKNQDNVLRSLVGGKTDGILVSALEQQSG